MITSCFLNSLNEHGIEVHETVSFLVDLARYLPDGVGTLSNFVGTAPVHVSRPFDPRNLTAGINEYTEGARSLVRFGMAKAMTRERKSRSQTTPARRLPARLRGRIRRMATSSCARPRSASPIR
jgi:hypothetical protein